MTRRAAATVATAAALLFLAACEEQREIGPALDLERVRSLTGAAAPAEAPAAQTARAPGIVSRSDSLISTTIHGDTDHPDIPTFRFRADCSGTQCRISDPSTGFSQTVRLTDLEFLAADTVAVGTSHGITLMAGTSRIPDHEATALGAWMEHSSFAVQMERVSEPFVTLDGRYGLAGGDLTGTRPTAGATWLGVMVGTPATGNRRGDRLQGIAALNYDLTSDSLDVAFSSIKNIDRVTAHSTEVVIFADLHIGSRGTFEAGLTGNRIQGGFYGPGHAEAAGIFEQSNIVGAFGARRQ